MNGEAGSNRTRLLIAGGVALLLVLAIAGGALLASGAGGGDDDRTAFGSGGSAPEQEIFDLEPAARAAGCRLQDFPFRTDKRITAKPVRYSTDPPHFGRLAPQPADVRAYYVRPPRTEALVHSLYHGRIIIWFKPGLPGSDKNDLKALYDEDDPHMIMAPRGSMEPEVAASAWTHLLLCPEMNDKVFDAIRGFRDAYRDRAPEFVP